MNRKEIIAVVDYLEKEFNCRICHAPDKGLSFFAELCSAHLNKYCDCAKRSGADKRRHCVNFDNRDAVEWGKIHHAAFAKICPYGLMEISAPIQFQQQNFGLLHAGPFRKPDTLREQDLMARRQIPLDELAALKKTMPVLTPERRKHLEPLLAMLAQAVAVLAAGNQEVAAKQIGPKEFIRHYINTNFRSQIGLVDIALKLDWCEAHASRQIKALFGIPFNELLNQARLENACLLLMESNYQVCNIALWSGFHDPQYFHRIFRKQFGCTPKEYRTNQRVSITPGPPRPEAPR